MCGVLLIRVDFLFGDSVHGVAYLVLTFLEWQLAALSVLEV